jgi:predicted RNA-binding protein with PIN domain
VRRLIVDGMNVMGSRPDGWWRDRDAAARRLIDGLRWFAERTGNEVTVVLDGRPLPGLAEGAHGPLTVRYAQRAGANAADDRIVEIVARDPNPEALEVVTADRDLRARVSCLGASVSGPRALLEALDDGHQVGRLAVLECVENDLPLGRASSGGAT